MSCSMTRHGDPTGARPPTSGGDFSFLFHFAKTFMSANRIAPDGMPRFATSHLGHSVCLCPIKRTPCLYGLI